MFYLTRVYIDSYVGHEDQTGYGQHRNPSACGYGDGWHQSYSKGGYGFALGGDQTGEGGVEL